MERLLNLVRGVREKLFGFRMDEVMSGTHEFEPGRGPAGRHDFRSP